MLNVELGKNTKYSKFDSWVTWHDHIWWVGIVKRPNVDKNADTFWHSGSNSQKVHFWMALIYTFGMIYNLFGFEEVRILPLFLVKTSLWCQFLLFCFHIFMFAYFVKHNMSYYLQLSRLSGCNFKEKSGNPPPPPPSTVPREKSPVLLGLIYISFIPTVDFVSNRLLSALNLIH